MVTVFCCFVLFNGDKSPTIRLHIALYYNWWMGDISELLDNTSVIFTILSTYYL